MKHVLVTGASGFIGTHLVRHLSDRGATVSCLVRPKSDRRQLEPFRPRFVAGDVTDPESLRPALQGVDVVYHLAGLTKSLSAGRLHEVNEVGVRNVAACCAAQRQPPVLVMASSLAAAGPAPLDRARTEADAANPVSAYGRSKRAGELAAREYAAHVPTTIVRPPIVLGEGDRDGFAMFEGIAKWGIHVVPGLRDYQFSTIHAADLAAALVLAAGLGRRLSSADEAQGTYFAAADETLTYADLGRLIGDVLGRPRVMVVRSPQAMVWAIAGVNEAVSQLRRRPHILSLDKAREATAGSWTCSALAIRQDTGFAPAQPLRQRLLQTVHWYFEQGWLKKSKRQLQAPG
jgi:nucleoside-diphosphate-sugar epimerase